MLEVAEKYKDKSCNDYFSCEKCPLHLMYCQRLFKDYRANFKDLEFEDGVPENIKNCVKEILKEE